ncbi:hypothetical protein C8J57DRAFT_1212369 [Mycena rebaudengoi]|nr:hypothetical protein C8J57DRAFT_1212369 [Mycena rebaudengoi]
MSGPIGRPRGSKNKPDHQAGGARPGSGPKRRDVGEASGSGTRSAPEAPDSQPRTPPVWNSKIIRGNGIADLYNIFKPKLSQQATSATQNSAGHESSTEEMDTAEAAPFPFLRPEPLDSDSDDESEADSDFEDLLDEAIPSKSLPDETRVDTEVVYGPNAMSRAHSGFIHHPPFLLYKNPSSPQDYIFHRCLFGSLT